MSDQELLKFREDLHRNPELLGEFELHELINRTLKQHDEVRFRRKLRETFQEGAGGGAGDSLRVKSVSGKRQYKYIYLLPFALLIPMVFFFFFRGETIHPDEIYSKYFTDYVQDILSRSNHSGHADGLSEGVFHYREKKYTVAVNDLTCFLKEDSTNVTARFYRAISEMAASEFDIAELDLQFVLDREFNYYQEHARWYLGLCYLKKGDLPGAEQIFQRLEAQNSIYSKKSKEILQFLSDFK